jgi:hypothetical protein
VFVPTADSCTAAKKPLAGLRLLRFRPHEPAAHRARFLTVPGRCASFSSMSKLLSGSKNEANAPRLRNWTVALIRNRGPLNHGLQFLGFVEASDAKAAEVAAAKDFGLTNFQCKRLLVQEAGRDH